MLNKILQLERPLAVLDLETTGLNPDADRIVQIAITIHYPHRDSIAWSSLINPEVPIMNTGNHGITDVMIGSCYKCKREPATHPTVDCSEFIPVPKFKDIAPALAPKLTNVDIMGYNVKEFDVKFVRAEMKRAGVEWTWDGFVIDPLHIYRMRKGHTLENCYKEYVDKNGFVGAHNAAVDVAATEAALIGQLNRYEDLPRTVKELSGFCFPHPENALDSTGKFVWAGSDAAFNFGKWRGRLLKDPEVRSYLHWIANKGDFSDEVKSIAQDALDGQFPVKGE